MPVFIVGDCTGHGIPGAVLSLMCNVLIRESFNRPDINSPSEALEFIRTRLVKFFKANSDKSIRDGMDAAFCVLNKTQNKLYFSGGYNSCIILRGVELIEHRGDRQHIGYSDNPKPFTNQTINVQSGDQIFLCTDGYQDQFGGERGKKFSKRRLHQLLIDSSQLSMQDKGIFLETEFRNWKRDMEQVDDVTILGLKIE